jgi:hypothetical protein
LPTVKHWTKATASGYPQRSESVTTPALGSVVRLELVPSPALRSVGSRLSGL